MSNAKTFRFTPNDTLMFREGFPFNQGDEGASTAQSVFPPYPPTIVGAVRLALARQMGFPRENWPTGRLGNGVNWQADTCQLGPLRFGPPMLERYEDGKYSPLFPAPLHLAEAKDDKKEQQTVLLSPAAEMSSDIGTVRFPTAGAGFEGIEIKDEHYVTRNGMAQILAGRVPDKDDILDINQLWQTETRVGIGINPNTRHVNEGELYTAGHVRLCDQISLSITVEGLPDSTNFQPVTQVLGGEHRMTGMAATQSPKPYFDPTTPHEAGKYALIALSPVYLSDAPEPEQPLEGITDELVSGALGKPVWVGGWDSQTGRPIPMRQMIPAGSVFFIESGNNMKIGTTIKIGKATNWGFGHCLVANWRQET